MPYPRKTLYAARRLCAEQAAIAGCGRGMFSARPRVFPAGRPVHLPAVLRGGRCRILPGLTVGRRMFCFFAASRHCDNLFQNLLYFAPARLSRRRERGGVGGASSCVAGLCIRIPYARSFFFRISRSRIMDECGRKRGGVCQRRPAETGTQYSFFFRAIYLFFFAFFAVLCRRENRRFLHFMVRYCAIIFLVLTHIAWFDRHRRTSCIH